MKWLVSKSMTANSEFSAGNRPPQNNDLVSPASRCLAKRTIVFLLAVIVLAGIVAVAARTSIDVLQSSQAQSTVSQ